MFNATPIPTLLFPNNVTSITQPWIHVIENGKGLWQPQWIVVRFAWYLKKQSVVRVSNHGTKTYTYRKAKIGQVQIHWKSFERITLAISKEVLDKGARVFFWPSLSRPLGEDINVQCRPDQWLMSSWRATKMWPILLKILKKAHPAFPKVSEMRLSQVMWKVSLKSRPVKSSTHNKVCSTSLHSIVFTMHWGGSVFKKHSSSQLTETWSGSLCTHIEFWNLICQFFFYHFSYFSKLYSM